LIEVVSSVVGYNGGMDTNQAPLAGVRIIDATAFLAGPFAGLMLADLGADVVKIEAPTGDPLRRFDRRGAPVPPMLASINRNKRSIALDLKDPGDQATFLALVGDADVLLHNWRPATERSLGLADQRLEAANPRLIRVAITGYGPDGPRADDPAFDSAVQAYCGLMAHQGGAEEPTLVRTYVADKTASGFAVQGVLAALLARERNGRGARLDVAMLDVLAYYDFPDVLEDHVFPDVEAPPPLSHARVTSVRTADGRLTMAPGTGQQVKAAMAVAGHPEWKEELVRIRDREELASRLLQLLEPVLVTETTERWVERFRAAGVPVAPVLDPAGHLADAQVRHNRIYVEYEHPEHGRVRAARHPVRMAGTRAVAPTPYPALDEHGAAIRDALAEPPSS
jgi:crotonobetainyl-CoA:carnitine CoA-transferase CaiB-like acyl-CoA transferase